MARPKGEPSRAFTIRFPERLLKKIDRFIRGLQKVNPSLPLCRADAIRLLVDHGADALPENFLPTSKRLSTGQIQALAESRPSPQLREFPEEQIEYWLTADRGPTRRKSR